MPDFDAHVVATQQRLLQNLWSDRDKVGFKKAARSRLLEAIPHNNGNLRASDKSVEQAKQK